LDDAVALTGKAHDGIVVRMVAPERRLCMLIQVLAIYEGHREKIALLGHSPTPKY
jgi:hypothetical protein